GAYFYSDSINDLPLLEQVAHPHVVNPDPLLREQAEAKGWPQLSWA
ncbi:MAG TPA: HAD-IB family hydrolase, partial [Pseudomonas sp.]|nr:HAD-IB family hydrolase [Pseudomonas sp.]